MKPIEKLSNSELLEHLNKAEKVIECALKARSEASLIGLTITEHDNATYFIVRKCSEYVEKLKDEAIRRNAKKGAEQIQLFI